MLISAVKISKFDSEKQWNRSLKTMSWCILRCRSSVAPLKLFFRHLSIQKYGKIATLVLVKQLKQAYSYLKICFPLRYFFSTSLKISFYNHGGKFLTAEKHLFHLPPPSRVILTCSMINERKKNLTKYLTIELARIMNIIADISNSPDMRVNINKQKLLDWVKKILIEIMNSIAYICKTVQKDYI